MTTFEVEIKFQIEDIEQLEHQLHQQNCAGFGQQFEDYDSFFQHPSRDFVKTDECLRLRNRVLPDGHSEHSLTYKGPKRDALTKTRQEIEITVTEPSQWESMLKALGFQKTAELHKHRRRQTLTINHRQIDIVLDTVPALPTPKHQFLELETLASEPEIEECREMLLGLAHQLGLREPIRESYLNLVQSHTKTKST